MTVTFEAPIHDGRGLTNMDEFEERLHEGGGNNGWNNNGNGDDNNGGGGGGGDEYRPDPERPFGAGLFVSFPLMGLGTAWGVYNWSKYGEWGRERVVSVPGKGTKIEQDFSNHAKVVDAGMFLGPILLGTAIGVVAGKKFQNFIDSL